MEATGFLEAANFELKLSKLSLLNFLHFFVRDSADSSKGKGLQFGFTFYVCVRTQSDIKYFYKILFA